MPEIEWNGVTFLVAVFLFAATVGVVHFVHAAAAYWLGRFIAILRPGERKCHVSLFFMAQAAPFVWVVALAAITFNMGLALTAIPAPEAPLASGAGTVFAIFFYMLYLKWVVAASHEGGLQRKPLLMAMSLD